MVTTGFCAIFITVTLLYSCFILLHIIYWGVLEEFKPKPGALNTRVTIIVPARNEEKNIGFCMQSLLEQDYPAHLFEIIVCDDQSEDRTKEEGLKVLAGSAIKHQLIRITKSPSNKKKAIEAGIKASSGELILITDADCVAGKSWVSYMAAFYEKTHAAMICGPVALRQEKKYCEKFQGLEMCGLSLLSGAGIKAGIPILSNAANIAYTRKAFEEADGFKDIDKNPSGDDTLLMFKLHKKLPGSIHYLKSPEAVISSSAQHTWNDFFQQRIRWASKGFSSNNSLNSIVSLLVFLANFLSLIGLILLFIYPETIKITVISLICKLLVDFLLLSFAAKFFNKGKLLLFYPLAAITVMLYTSLVGIMANFVSFNWKGRKY